MTPELLKTVFKLFLLRFLHMISFPIRFLCTSTAWWRSNPTYNINIPFINFNPSMTTYNFNHISGTVTLLKYMWSLICQQCESLYAIQMCTGTGKTVSFTIAKKVDKIVSFVYKTFLLMFWQILPQDFMHIYLSMLLPVFFYNFNFYFKDLIPY